MADSPTYAAAALGYRTWLLQDNRLFSTGKGETIWIPGVNQARCDEHDSPHEECSCGLYAYHRLSRAQDLYEKVNLVSRIYGPRKVFPLIGAVAFRGRVQSHHDGLRGEEACILALALIPGSFTAEQESEAEQIAADYGVPLVLLDEIEGYALQHALPVPVADRGELPSRRESLLVPYLALACCIPAVIVTLCMFLLSIFDPDLVLKHDGPVGRIGGSLLLSVCVLFSVLAVRITWAGVRDARRGREPDAKGHRSIA